MESKATMPQTNDPNQISANAVRPASPDDPVRLTLPAYTRPAIVFRTPLEAVANVCSGPGAKVRGICALENS